VLRESLSGSLVGRSLGQPLLLTELLDDVGQFVVEFIRAFDGLVNDILLDIYVFLRIGGPLHRLDDVGVGL
jgi:hypothetical protein